MKSKDLPPELRKKLGLTLMGGRTRKALAPAVTGMVWFWLEGAPPTATHHDKEIAHRFGKGGRKHLTLRDSEALVRAREWYEQRIHERAELVPIAGPVVADVHFFYPLVEGKHECEFCQQKPDRDNAAKLLFDVLALRGWVVADEQIAAGMITKHYSNSPGVEVRLRTLLNSVHDDMKTKTIGRPGEIERISDRLSPHDSHFADHRYRDYWLRAGYPDAIHNAAIRFRPTLLPTPPSAPLATSQPIQPPKVLAAVQKPRPRKSRPIGPADEGRTP